MLSITKRKEDAVYFLQSSNFKDTIKHNTKQITLKVCFVVILLCGSDLCVGSFSSFTFLCLTMCFFSLPLLFVWFWHREKENVKLMSALHGTTHPLGRRDNQFTWQHRAKNICAALKITGERQKRRGGALPSHTYLCTPQDGATVLRHDQRCAWERKEDNPRVRATEQDRFMQER